MSDTTSPEQRNEEFKKSHNPPVDTGNWKLVYASTGYPVRFHSEIKSPDGRKIEKVRGGWRPQTEEDHGSVITSEGTRQPGIYGMVWVNEEERPLEGYSAKTRAKWESLGYKPIRNAQPFGLVIEPETSKVIVFTSYQVEKIDP